MNAVLNQTVTHFALFGGSGSGAAGFNDADPSIGAIKGRMVCVGGIDVDPRACADFKMMTGVEQLCADLFSRDQYMAWNGRPPPPSWREADANTVRRAAHGHFPDIVFLSAPCKGFSGLLPAAHASTPKYWALNELTLRGVWLTMEAFADDLPGLILFENVPRIATRGRHLLDQIASMLHHYGYATAETTHDCGELGDGLGQSRRRFLMVARLVRKVPPFLYEPPKRPLRSVGEILGHMPLPGDPLGGPMHRIPALQWKTWVRLAFVEAGSDWRSLSRLAVENGYLRDYLILPVGTDWHAGSMGVRRWSQPSGTVTGNAGVTTGSFSVADPRFAASAAWHDGQAYGVRHWAEPTGAIAGQQAPGQGAYAVADPRHTGPAKHSNEFAIVDWDGAARAVTSAHGAGQAVADPRADSGFLGKGKYRVTALDEAAGTVIARSDTGQGAYAVADPRPADNPGRHHQMYRIAPWGGHSGTVTGSQQVGSGAQCVADPRPRLHREKGDAYLTAGHYGVVRYTDPSGAISASACHDNGPWSVADPRLVLPAPNDRLVARIMSLDGTWHRPFTTLELAALQSFIDPEEYFAADGPADRGERFVLDGASDQRWREAIGNAVPRKAARAIGTVMGQTILLARNGETFMLSSTPIWVQPMVTALACATGARE